MIEDMAVVLVLDGCIGFCKEWEKVIRSRGNSGSKDGDKNVLGRRGIVIGASCLSEEK